MPVTRLTGGVVTNPSGTTISGNPAIYITRGLGSVDNLGLILGVSGQGVSLKAGGDVSNGANGQIDGTHGVVFSTKAGSVTNAGSIAGGTGGGILNAGGRGEVNRRLVGHRSRGSMTRARLATRQI